MCSGARAGQLSVTDEERQVVFPWMRDPRPMNDEWLSEEIADITLMLEILERQHRQVADERRAYLEYLRRAATQANRDQAEAPDRRYAMILP